MRSRVRWQTASETDNVAFELLGLVNGKWQVLTDLIASQNIPALLGEKLRLIADSPYVFLMIVNLLLLLIGMFMESISAILIVLPVLLPIAVGYDIDPVQFGVMVVLNLMIGMITPPVGLCLFIVAAISKEPLEKVAMAILPMICLAIFVLLLVAFVPALTLSLPTWLGA